MISLPTNLKQRARCIFNLKLNNLAAGEGEEGVVLEGMRARRLLPMFLQHPEHGRGRSCWIERAGAHLSPLSSLSPLRKLLVRQQRHVSSLFI